MSQKDIIGKNLFIHNDIFADVGNVLIFHGKDIIKPEDLEDAATHSQFKANNGEFHEQMIDVSKFWKKHGFAISLLSIENQTKSEKDMPLRVIGYDGASYKSQLLTKEVKRYYPVITLVLYYGRTHWNYSHQLIDLLKIPEYIEEDFKAVTNKFIMDGLFEISFLDPETVKMFKSDFRIVADYFVQTRTNREYSPSSQKIDHVYEILDVMKAITQKEWNNEIIDTLIEKGEPITMESAYKEVMEKGRNEGISIGEARGRNEGRISVYYEDMKMSPEDISKKMNEPLDVVNKVIQKLKK